jgi:hypothetical protein
MNVAERTGREAPGMIGTGRRAESIAKPKDVTRSARVKIVVPSSTLHSGVLP